ncbi:MAG TPA: O-antigen ligase family protein [Pirellulales bacterium]|jgi:O-antigen ligase/tetratricopeptide (TPR) repeat protein|nr:O-antigen ligase family protein [Pirellulales bacterium]
MHLASKNPGLDWRASAGNIRPPRVDSTRVAGQLARCADVALCALIVLLPWCMGGRHAFGELLLVVLAFTSALACLTRQLLVDGRMRCTRSSVAWIGLAAIGLLALQLAPLPSDWLRAISPRLQQILPLWTSGKTAELGLGTWNQLSVHPAATQSALTIALAYCCLAFTVMDCAKRIDDVERIVRWVAVSAALTAGFGLVQYLTANGLFFWVYQHPYRQTFGGATGAFINKNHFAHLLALGCGPLLWWVVCASMSDVRRAKSSRDAWPQIVLMVALGILLFAGLCSLSRGGIAAIGMALAVSGAGMWRAGLLDARLAKGAGAVIGLVLVALAIHGYAPVTDRLNDYVAGSVSELDRDGGRRAIWRANLTAFREFSLTGTGVGTHRAAYPMYLARPFATEFTHAESGYLQIASEAGLVGLGLLAFAMASAGCWCATALRGAGSPSALGLAAAICASLLASALHSAVDFVWYIPSCMAMTVVLATCALRLAQLADSQSRPVAWPLPRPASLVAACMLFMAAMWAIQDRLCAAIAAPSWERYLAYSLTPEAQSGQATPSPEILADLQTVTRWTPGDARAQLCLAEACLQRFEVLQSQSDNPMPLSQIRDAALASRFTTRAALDEWLSRALAERRTYLDLALWHTRRAIEECPLEGQAYAYLAELCFMCGPHEQAKSAILEQALRVRPFDPSVRMCAGSEAALVGNAQAAVEHWRVAYKSSPKAQRHLAQLWATAGLPLPFVLGAFQPDLTATRFLSEQYESAVTPAAMASLWRYQVQLGESEASRLQGPAAAALWLEVADAHRRLNEPDRQAHALHRSSEMAGSDYTLRRRLGEMLFNLGQFAAAEEQLDWCRQRNPEDHTLGELLARARKARLGISSASAQLGPAVK